MVLIAIFECCCDDFVRFADVQFHKTEELHNGDVVGAVIATGRLLREIQDGRFP